MTELTPYLLNIPRAVAQEMVNRWRGALHYWEDMVAEGNLALVEIAHRFDPSLCFNGMDGFAPYAVRGVRQRVFTFIRKEIRCFEKHRSIDYSAKLHHRMGGREGDGRGATGQPQGLKDLLIGDEPDPGDAAQWEDTLARLAKDVTPREREVLVLAAKGYTVAEMASLLGVSREAVNQARERMRGRLGWFREEYDAEHHSRGSGKKRLYPSRRAGPPAAGGNRAVG